MCFHFQCLSKNMKHNNTTTEFHDAADEADDALSLSDLPLDDDVDVEDTTTTTTNSNRNNNLEEIITSSSRSGPQSSTEPQDEQFFEFLSDHSSDYMCPAEDIIFCGKLIPSIPQPPSSSSSAPPPLLSQQTKSLFSEEDKSSADLLHRRSESFSKLQSYVTRSKSTKNHQYLRISRSLDYQKLRRIGSSKTSPDLDIQRSASVKSSGKEDVKKAASSSRPKWYLPMFGIVKFPPEMDMRDIKSRNFRRSSMDSDGIFSANRSTGKSSSSSSSSWRLIKALSCSDHASVAVTAPFCVSRA